MQDFAQWLERKKGGPKRRGRIKPISDKRRLAAATYSKRRKEYLAAHPFCEAHPIIWPENKIVPRSVDVHHCCGRTGTNYLDTGTWLAVSRGAHNWIHSNPSQARQIGLLK